MVELLGAQDFSKRVDFEAVETTIKAEAMAFAASLLEVFMNADTSDHAENLLPCPYGCMARYRGVRSRKLTTVVGNIEYERAYTIASNAGTAFIPKIRPWAWIQAACPPGWFA